MVKEMEPPTKRRRISGPGTTGTVNKPFRSPLKQINNNAPVSGSAIPTSTLLNPGNFSTAKGVKSSLHVTLSKPTLTVSPKRTSSTPSEQSHVKPTLKQLEGLVLSARRTNETLAHALSLVSNPQKDLELSALTKKWRSASRMAAEEVYGLARDKVNSMGGMTAWKAREKELAHKRRWDWGEDEVQRDNNDEEYTDREDSIDDEEEEEFTMDVLLKNMGIELDVIGFDEEKGTWTSEYHGK